MIISIEPMGAPRMVRSDKWANRPVVARYHAYKDVINLTLPGYQLPLALTIDFHIAMPKTWSAKKKASMAGTLHCQKPDIDNLVKGFMDAFHTDDAHVAILHAKKSWCLEGEAPCIILVE